MIGGKKLNIFMLLTNECVCLLFIMHCDWLEFDLSWPFFGTYFYTYCHLNKGKNSTLVLFQEVPSTALATGDFAIILEWLRSCQSQDEILLQCTTYMLYL